jgi:hypothetical protein
MKIHGDDEFRPDLTPIYSRKEAKQMGLEFSP